MGWFSWRKKVVHHHHHDHSAQHNHNLRMQQLANSRAAARAREESARRSDELRAQQQRDASAAQAAQASRQHTYRMEQLAKQKALEMQHEQERQRAAQRAFEERKKQMKLKEKNEAITRVKGDITRYETRNKEIQHQLAKKLKPELNEIEKELKEANHDIETFNTNSQRILEDINQENKKLTEKYKAADDKIRDAIKTTNVDESNIPQFLNLVNDGLLFATMRGQHERDKMTAKLKVFSDLMKRACSAKLAIETCFEDEGLQRFTPILAEEGYTKMFELKCDDDEEWKELKTMMEEQLLKDEDKKKQKMKVKERNALKKLCMKWDKTWLPDQNMQQNIVRKSLLTSAPRLSKFFGILHEVTAEVDELLKLSPKLTEQQQHAIAYAAKSTAIKPRIEEKHNQDDDESVEDINERQLWDKDSECLIFPQGGNVWCCGRIADIIYDERGEWLQVEYKVENETKSVRTARFSKDIQPINTRKSWDKGSKCEIYSESEGKWVKACVVNVKNDNMGEWLQVEYVVDDKARTKDIGRYSPQIRCCVHIEEDEYSQSKEVANIQFKQEDMNMTNKQCNALNTVAIQKLHITESLVGDFVVDEKEIEAMESQINVELAPKQKELKEKKDQLEDIAVDIEIVKEEIELLEEEEEENEEDSDKSGSDSDDEEEDDKKENIKEQIKGLKKKKKKLKLKRKKIELKVVKLEKQIDAIEIRRGEIVSIGDVLKEAFTVASNIEDSCLQIIKTQCVTRQSILLARELLKYKPAKPHATAKPLWDTITKGIGDIFDNALQLNKISATYFGFFTKFQYSFDHFVTCNKMNKNVSMLVALEHLSTDVKDIQLFQAQMDNKVDLLRESAVKTIRDCVSNTAGATEFETAMNQRKIAETALREVNKKYNTQKFKFDDEFQEKFGTQQQCIATKNNIEYEIQELNKNAAMNQEWINQLSAQVKALESLMVT